MSGVASLGNQLFHREAAASEVNRLLERIRATYATACHEWFRLKHFEVEPSLPRRKTVGDRALAEWQRALFFVRALPGQFGDRWAADEQTMRLLHELAARAPQPVRVPAACALIVLSQMPPLATIREIVDLHQSGQLWYYASGVRPPRWWTRPCVTYRANRWEQLCVRLAEQLYGEDNVLAGSRNETRCSEGIVPDIIVGPVQRDAAGHVEWADRIIDAKSGGLPDEHAYAHLCATLEYWHALVHGEWVVSRPDNRGCQIIYRDVNELISLAPEPLCSEIEQFARECDHLSLYLRFLEDCTLRGASLDDVRNLGALDVEAS